MAKQVAIHDLIPGMFIVGVIEQNGPVKIRKSGLVTSHEMVQGLSEMGVLSVAIDPEKTVEIELEDAVHVSQTQFVMQANEEKASKDTDTHLSEQFNRSLFMPSLQKVPSAWQYYGTKAAVAVLVTALGFSSGWFISQAPQLLNEKSVQIVDTSTDTTLASESTNSAVIEQTAGVAEAGSQTLQPELIEEKITAETALASPVDSQNTSIESQPQAVTNSTSSSQNTSVGSDTIGNELTSADSVNSISSTGPENQVSAELLQRFEKAMADLEKESAPETNFADDGDTPEYGDENNDFSSTDVQRVDQLPARVMTRLPRMSFSAHMYASNPRNRWVKVNGVEMGEGEWLNNKVFIERIEPQHVILIFEDHQFSMRALSEW